MTALAYALTADRGADTGPSTAEIEAIGTARPLAAAGSIAATSHTRAAGMSARARERAERRAIRRFVRKHREHQP